MLESFDDGALVFGPDGRVLACNAAAAGLLGRDARTIPGRLVDDLLASPVLSPATGLREGAGAAAAPRRIDIPRGMQRRTVELTVRGTAEPAADRRYVAILRDTGPAERLLVALDAVPIGLAIYDGAERLVHYNAFFAERLAAVLAALQPEPTFEQFVRECIRIGDLARLRDDIEADVGLRLERFRTAAAADAMVVGGRRYVVEHHRLADGGRVMSAVDVEAGWRQAQELRHQKAHLGLLLDNAIDAIVAADERGGIENFSRAAERMFGYTAADMIGRNVRDLMPPDVRRHHDRYIAGYVEGGPARIIGVGREVEAQHADGRRFPVHLGIGEFQGADGRRRFVATIRDLTDLRETEAQLRQAQKMEVVGQLTGGVAHDFNNLLSVVIGNGQLLADRAAAGGTWSDDDREMLDELLAAARRGGDLTNRMLAFSRRQTLSPRVIKVDEAVAELGDLFRRAINETIVFDLRLRDGAPVRIDPAQLQNALLNLVLNARDAMPEGGLLTLRTRDAHVVPGLRDIETEIPPGDYVVIEVTDTGTGIAPEHLSRVTEPFFTTKRVGAGTGLGLSMVYGFVRQSGGYLQIDSELGLGTRVAILLPCADGSPVPEPRALPDRAADPEEPLPAATGLTVMVVEDDARVRGTAVHLLRSLGYAPVEAVDAVEALALFDGGLVVDLVLSDVMLPRGMSGVDLSRRLTRDRPALPVVLCSGYAEELLHEAGLAGHAREFLRKPYLRADLAAALARAFRRGPAG